MIAFFDANGFLILKIENEMELEDAVRWSQESKKTNDPKVLFLDQDIDIRKFRIQAGSDAH